MKGYIEVTDKEREYVIERISQSPSLGAWVDKLKGVKTLPLQRLEFFNHMIDNRNKLYRGMLN